MFSNKIAEFYQSICLKGGRMTKFKGQVASCAPHLGWCVSAAGAALAPVGTVLSPLALSMVMLGASSGHAWALNECGPQVPHVLCSSASYTVSPTPIDYSNTGSQRVDLELGGIAVTSNTVGLSGVRSTVNGNGDAVIDARNAGNVTTNASNAPGLWAISRGNGNAIVQINAGTIVTGNQFSYGAEAIKETGGTAGDTNILMTGGIIRTGGSNSHGLYSRNRSAGAAGLTMTGGSVTTAGTGAFGVVVETGTNSTGLATMNMSGGSINAGGVAGILVHQVGLGVGQVNMTGGSVTGRSHGIWLSTSSASNAQNQSVVITSGTVTGTIGNGIQAQSRRGNITVNVSNATVRGGSTGIRPTSDTGSYNVNVGSGGNVIGGGNAAIHGQTGSTTVLNTVNIASGATVNGSASGVSVRDGTNNRTNVTTRGNVTGNILMGANVDNVNVAAGFVNGHIDMGSGNDSTAASGGTVNGDIYMGTGNDSTIVGAGSVTGTIFGDAGDDTATVIGGSTRSIDMGTGTDTINVAAGSLTGNAFGGLGNDTINLSGGTVTGTFFGDGGAETAADGNDAFVWTGGVLNGGFDGQNGSDRATIHSSVTTYDGSQRLDGGDDVSTADGWIDVLTINNQTVTANGGNIVNWEVINLNNHDITVTDLVTGTVNVCNGSTTLSGNSVADDMLGCVSPDTIIVTDNTVINNVIEGAGGADTIQVLGDASVTNGVFGAGDGNDGSAALDDGDTIVINTTGTVEGVWGGDDQDVADGVSGDRITWTNGTINDGIYGGNGSDQATVTASQYDGTQILDGGDDASSADGMIDELTLQGVTVTANSGSIRNWEVVNLIDSVITIPDLVTETVNVCNGSTTLSGNSMANDVLGCVSPDTIILTDNTVINNVVEGAGGADDIQVLGNASVAQGVFGAGEGNDNSADQDQGDNIVINTAGTVEGVWGGDDMDVADGVSGDRITWSNGTINDGIYGGNGSDLVNVTADQYDGTQILDGGDDILTTDGMIDVLTLDGITATANSGTIRNWELVDLIDPDIEIIDPEIPTITTCNGSVTLSGTGTVDQVLGCIEPDTIIVTDNVDITNVIEGAGGADTIQITGNADVGVGVFGAGEGQDMSAASDEGDTILIDTTGTVQGVWGGDDQDINDGVSGDRITWSNGTIVDGIYGGNGSDLVNVTADQYDGTQILDGGDDTLRTDGMIDVLTLDGITATANSGTIRNWELVELIDPEVEIIDPEIPVIHTCNGSLTLSGTGTVNEVLGCVSPDTIIVTDNVEITDVIEGAGGADTIEVTGNADVANGVFGAGDGQDMSGDQDAGDTIVIDTTGTVEGVWGGDDSNVADGVSGDTITWSNGTINDGIYGENGSDRAIVTASQYDGTQILDGGDDTSVDDGMIDVLELNGVTVTANSGTIRNWEVVSVGPDSEVEIPDPEIPVVNVCDGSVTLSGTGSVDQVLGCVEPDTIIVTDNVTVTDVIEGAGGADLIEVTGNADVANGIFGAGDGQDNSGDQDAGDTILLDTTGTTAGIWGGDDSDIADGVSGDTITWNDGTITDGIYGENGSDTVVINADDYDGSQKIDGGDDTSPADGMVDDLTLNGLTVAANGADISNWELVTVNGGELTIDDGRWDVGEPGVDGTGVVLTGGGDLEALDELVLDGNLTIDPGSTFIGTGAGEGVYVVTGDVRNAGLITTVDDVVGDTFTVGGDYDGTGGRIEHDVDTSTGTGDQTIIEGDVTGGPTDLVVNNITPTTGDGRDIPVVVVGGETGAGDFTLNGGPFIAGAFVYDLELMQNTWFLSPDFQPATPIYEVYPDVLLALNGLSSNQRRTGGRYWRGESLPPEPPVETVFCKDASQNFRCPVTVDQADYYADKADRLPDVIEGGAIWTRIEGAHSHNEPYISDTGAEYDLTTMSVEAGLDALLYESEAGKLLAGVSAHYRRGWANITSAFGNGHIYTQGFGVGANLSWYGSNGFYLDAQGQATWYTSDLESDELGTLTEGNDAFGYALSLEAGKRIGLGDHWTLVPQAQLVWSSVDFDTFTGPNGEVVAPFDGESLRGRFGMALEHENSWRGEDGAVQRSRFYGIANVYYEFLDGTEVTVGQTRIARANDPWVGELGIGAQYNWADDKYSIYGELAASTGLKTFGDSYRYRGHLGFRVKW